MSMSIVSVHGPYTWGEPNLARSEEILINLIGDTLIEVKARRMRIVGGDPYLWDFGDGSQKINGYEVTHQYGQPDRYTVTLEIQTEDGVVTDSVTFTLPGGVKKLPLKTKRRKAA